MAVTTAIRSTALYVAVRTGRSASQAYILYDDAGQGDMS